MNDSEKTESFNYVVDSNAVEIDVSSPVPAQGENIDSVDSQIAGFWIRFLAFFIDWLIIGLICLGFGALFCSQLSSLGEVGRVVGFIIATAYLGIMNSKICAGQTIGKKITKLKVVDKSGKAIPFSKSILRAAILAIPLSLNNYYVSSQSLVILVLMAIGIWLGIAVIYINVFNIKTRQSLHDLIFQTYVVRRTSEGEIISPVVSKIHYYIVGALLVLFIVLPITMLNNPTAPISVNDDKSEIVKFLGGKSSLIDISVSDQLAGKDGPFNTKIVTVIFKRQPDSFNYEADQLAKWCIENLKLENDSVLDINLSYGYNLGLANSITQYEAVDKVSGWKKHFETNNESESSMIDTSKMVRCGFFYFNFHINKKTE